MNESSNLYHSLSILSSLSRAACSGSITETVSTMPKGKRVYLFDFAFDKNHKMSFLIRDKANRTRTNIHIEMEDLSVSIKNDPRSEQDKTFPLLAGAALGVLANESFRFFPLVANNFLPVPEEARLLSQINNLTESSEGTFVICRGDVSATPTKKTTTSLLLKIESSSARITEITTTEKRSTAELFTDAVDFLRKQPGSDRTLELLAEQDRLYNIKESKVAAVLAEAQCTYTLDWSEP